jgi:hypothetical protein
LRRTHRREPVDDRDGEQDQEVAEIADEVPHAVTDKCETRQEHDDPLVDADDVLTAGDAKGLPQRRRYGIRNTPIRNAPAAIIITAAGRFQRPLSSSCGTS